MAYIGTRTSPLLALALRVFSGVSTIIGDSERFGFLYTHHRPIYPNEHRVTRMLDTLSLWDGEKCTAPRFPLVISEKAGADAITRLRNAGLNPKEYVVIHPGSGRGLGYRDKRLPPAIIYNLIDEIRHGFPNHGVALIFGPDDLDLLSTFAELPVGAAALSGIPFDTTKAILSMSLAFVGGDTALGHVAAALEIPTFTVAGPTKIDESRPFGVASVVIKRRDPLSCQPCWNTPLQGHCPYETACITGLPAEFIYAPLYDQLCKAARAAGTNDHMEHEML
jgi:heptosyltransferase-2